ncbi:MAG: transglutaminase domain-containing protein [Candidatus Cloacimonadota bacterium]|nr:MAG: transglutaminase domain-containing protein [Candidatus Cloacimonadota bacterium]
MKKSRKLFFFIFGIICIAWIITILFALKFPFKKRKNIDFSFALDENVIELDICGYGIYVHGEKIGYSISKQEKTKQGFRISEKSFMNISAYGVSQEVTTYTVSEADLDLKLKTFYSEIISGIHTVRTNGIIENDSIFLVIESAGEKESVVLAIGDKPFIPGSIERVAQELKLQPDSVYHYAIFEPTSEKIVDIDICLRGKETITMDGKTYETDVVVVKMIGIESKLYLDEEGKLLMESSPMGITMKREPLDKIDDFAKGFEGLKIYETYAIYPKGSIKNPRKSKHLVADLIGVAEGYNFPTDERQKYSNGRVTIDVVEPVSGFSISDLDAAKFKKYLASTIFMPCDDDEFISLAKEISGNNEVTHDDILRIMDWVYKNIKKAPTFSIPYAKEVLKTKVGDCNEHAVLFSALVRAIGVPSKVVVGIVYVDGAFYYHAWNEYYWGRWIACDPTFGLHCADATHIKLEEGTLLDFIKVVKLVGQLNINIIESF